MPYKLAKVAGGYKVQDASGKFYSKEPLSKTQAARQLRALWANASPEAEKKEAGAHDAAGYLTPEHPIQPGDTATFTYNGVSTIAQWNGTEWQSVAYSGQVFAPALDPETGMDKEVSAVPTGINATGPAGLAGVMGMGGKKRWGKKKPVATKAGKPKGNVEGLAKHLAKKYGGDPGFFTKVVDDDELAEYPLETRQQIAARVHFIVTGHYPSQDKKEAKEAGTVVPKPKTVVLKPVITTKPDIAQRFLKWLAMVMHASKAGHSANFAMPLDGDGNDQPFEVEGVDLPKFTDTDAVRMSQAEIAKETKAYNQQEVLEILLADDESELLPAASSLSVFKDADGNYRWVLFSSNAFRDQDREIVSTKALEDDVERTDSQKEANFGPLRWWHLADPPVNLGTCDFRLVAGRTLIESGTFVNSAVGERVKEKAGNLQVSIGFNHPPDEPDADGVYHMVRVFERSLLPRGKAANPFTKVFVKGEKSMATKKEKLAALATLLGEETAKQILAGAGAAEKDLDERGVAFKEGEQVEAAAESEETPEGEADTEAEKAKKPFPGAAKPFGKGGKKPAGDSADEEDADGEEDSKAKKPAGKKPAEGSPEEEAAETPEEEAAEQEDDVIGNMTEKQFMEIMGKCMEKALEPVAKAMGEMKERMHSHDDKAEADAKKKEADERTALKEQVAALESQVAAQQKTVADQQAALAAAQAALSAATKALSDTGEALKTTNARLTELEGTQPRYTASGFVASQDASTVIDGERAKELGAPAADPATKGVQDFLNFAFSGPGAQLS